MGLIEAVSERISNAKDNAELDHLRSRLSGFLFEEMGHRYITRMFPNKKIIGPRETFEFYSQLLFPNSKVIERGILGTSLDGVTVPDGLSFNELGLVDGSLHYTSRRNVKNFSPLVTSFARDQNDYLMEFFSRQGKFTIVTPLNTVLVGLPKDYGNVEIEHIKMPITTFDLHERVSIEWEYCLRRSGLVIH